MNSFRRKNHFLAGYGFLIGTKIAFKRYGCLMSPEFRKCPKEVSKFVCRLCHPRRGRGTVAYLGLVEEGRRAYAVQRGGAFACGNLRCDFFLILVLRFKFQHHVKPG